jgi:hypothetical protein
VIILVTPRIIRSGYSPTITAGCDEQYGLELGERLGSTIVPSKSAKGYLPTDSSSYDPSDPFEKECLERPGEKQVLKRSAHSKE